MKLSVLVLSGWIVGMGLSSGQEKVDQSDTKILGSLSTGEPKPVEINAPTKRPIHKINRTIRRYKNGRNITIHEVSPAAVTKTARPTIAVPDLGKSDQLDHSQVEPTRMIFLSAAVYGHGRNKLTKLGFYHAGKQCEAWSNIDFNHLGGFGGFRVNGREYMHLLAVYKPRAKNGVVKSLAEAFADGCPQSERRLDSRETSFVVTSIEPSDQHSQRILEDIHEFYSKEKQTLKQAYKLREKNRDLRKASESIEGPPPPKPVTIYFWKRDMAKEQAASVSNSNGVGTERGGK